MRRTPRFSAWMLVLVACFAESDELPNTGSGPNDTSTGAIDESSSVTGSATSTTSSNDTTAESASTVGTSTTAVDETGSSSAASTVTSTSTDASSSTTSSTDSESGAVFEHQIFTTSQAFVGGAIGSLETADGICQRAAANGETWLAVLSDSQTAAEDRIQILGPVFNMQGEEVAADAEELWSGNASALVGFDENGDPISVSDLAWVGNATNHCGDWKSEAADAQVGLPTQTDVWLDTGAPFGCQFTLHIYCISQP